MCLDTYHLVDYTIYIFRIYDSLFIYIGLNSISIYITFQDKKSVVQG